MAKTKTTKKSSKETKSKVTKEKEIPVDRRAKDRREPDDRRQSSEPVEDERRSAPRRKVARRRQIDPTTCERDYNNDEIEFMHALDAYKRAAGRMFPTCSEILEVIRDLGYRRLTAEQLAVVEPPVVVAPGLEDVDTEVDALAEEDEFSDESFEDIG